MTSGRPVTRAQLDEFIRLIGEGYLRQDAAAAIGINYVTFWRAMRTDPEYKERVEVAEASGPLVTRVEKALYTAAEAGDVRAIGMVLTNRAPDRWTPPQKQLRIEGQIDHNHELTSGTNRDRIMELQRRWEARAELDSGIVDAEVVHDPAEEDDASTAHRPEEEDRGADGRRAADSDVRLDNASEDFCSETVAPASSPAQPARPPQRPSPKRAAPQDWTRGNVASE